MIQFVSISLPAQKQSTTSISKRVCSLYQPQLAFHKTSKVMIIKHTSRNYCGSIEMNRATE